MTVTMQDNGLGTVEALPVRSAVVRIPGDAYPGFAATMRLNPRRRVVDELRSGDIGRVSAAVSGLVLTWNFKDEQGQPLDPTPEDIYDLPDDLLAALLTGYFAAFGEATDVPLSSTAPSGTTSTTSASADTKTAD